MFVSLTLNWKECCEICCLNIVRSATEVKSDVLFYFSPCPYVCYCVTDHYIWCMSNNKIRERYHKKKGPMDHEVLYCQKKGSQTQKRGKLCATKYKNEREGYHYTNKFSEGSKNFTKLHLNICVK